MTLLNSSMNMWLIESVYIVFLALTQSYGISAFRGLDFTPVFKGPTYGPDDLPGSNLQTSSFKNRLRDIEERVDTVTSMESRLDDIEQRLEESKTNATDAKEIKAKMEKMEGELEDVQNTLSALNSVTNNVEQIQATVAASSAKNEQDKESLVGTLATTRGKVADIEADVGEMKSKLNTVEGNFQKLKTDLNSRGSTSRAPQQRGWNRGVGTREAPQQRDLNSRGSTSRAPQQRGWNRGVGTREAPQQRDARCPSDFMYDRTTKLCVKLVRAPSPSSDANINCLTQADDGRLVQLDTREKHKFVRGYLRSRGQRTDVYVGGIRDDRGKYTWLDGTEIKDAHWCRGQPERRGCVSLWKGMGFCLDDVLCSGRMAYVCEVPMDE